MVGYVLASNLYLVAVVDDEHFFFFFFFNGCRVPNIILEQCNKPYPYFSPPSGCFKSSIVIHIEAISKEPDWTGVKKKYCMMYQDAPKLRMRETLCCRATNSVPFWWRLHCLKYTNMFYFHVERTRKTQCEPMIAHKPVSEWGMLPETSE